MLEDAFNRIYTLCTDAGHSLINPLRDQVWELAEVGGEPPALDLRTTYGLRCLGMRLFPSFTNEGETLTDPRSFAQKPQIKECFANYLRLTCRPFSTIDVELEYWVPESDLVCGRVKITNRGSSPASLKMDWTARLNPGYKGTPMNAVEMGVNTVLQGACEDLYPVFFITGGPEVTTRSYPSLGFSFALPENASRRLSWGLAALDSPENSITRARHATSLNWDAELTKLALSEKSRTLEFSCAESDWPHWLGETQRHARQLLVNGLNREKTPHLVSQRSPDTRLQEEKLLRRNSALNGEADLYQLWQFSRVLLPADATSLKEVIHTLLEKQQPDGSLPLAVGPSGMVSMVKAPPLLASLVVEVHAYLQDETWLKQIYPQLTRALRCWFSEGAEQQPCWESALQTGLEHSPIFSTGQPGDQGLAPQTVFSPALAALLYHEAESLRQLAHQVDDPEADAWLNERREALLHVVDASFDEKSSAYRYRDAQSGRCDAPQTLREFKHNGLIQFKRNLKTPRRLLLSCSGLKSGSQPVQVIINGSLHKQPVSEKIHIGMQYYNSGFGHQTGQHLFDVIEAVEVSGLDKVATLSLSLAGTDRDDISLFLPLWAGMASNETAQAMIENTLLPNYLSPYGFTTFPLDQAPLETNSISPLWNTFIIEALLRYGYREVAASALTHLYNALFAQWNQNGHFSSSLRASDGKGSGERDSISGLVPIWPFLRMLGVEFLHPSQVILQGLNDRFAPFTVQYERVMLTLSQHSTVIETVNGSRTEIDQAGHYKILLP